MFCLTSAKIGKYTDIEKFLGDFYGFLRNEKSPVCRAGLSFNNDQVYHT